MSFSTADCQKYLVDVWGPKVAEMFDDEAITDHDKQTIKNALNPKKWKRVIKYAVGSDTDKSDECPHANGCMGCYVGMNFWERPGLAGGTARTFYLADTDHITVVLIERDGKIIYEEDYSD